MGMAASQARVLLLTSRKSDLEFRAQNITQRKMLLSMQTEDIANEYTRAISNRCMMFTWNVNANDGTPYSEVLTYNSLTSTNMTNTPSYRVVTGDGSVVVRNTSDPVLLSMLEETIKEKDEETGEVRTKTVQTGTLVPTSDGNYVIASVAGYSNSNQGQVVITNSLLDNTGLFQNALQQGTLFLEALEVNPDKNTSEWKSFSWSASEKFTEEYNTKDDAIAEAKYQSKMAEIQTTEKKLDAELKQIETQQTACQTEIDSVKSILKKNVETGFKVFG